MKFNAIPTLYKGIQFRSRIEARWAAFFDLLEWNWEYEPIDLQGYIPDFVITPKLYAPVLIEVKPLVEWPCACPGCTCGAKDPALIDMYKKTVEKIQASGWKKEALIVGATLPRSKSTEFARIGQPIESEVGSGSWWDTGSVFTRCPSCNAVVLKVDVDGFGAWHECGQERVLADPFDATPLWREAGNRVQWKSPARDAEKHRHVPLGEIAAFFRRMADELGGD